MDAIKGLPIGQRGQALKDAYGELLHAGAEHLASQIIGPHYYYRKGQSLHGALMIEPKEQMARRGLASPDRADTLMLAHAVDPAPREVAEGTRRRSSEEMYLLPGKSLGWMGV